MLFTSFEFAIFLPVVFILYWFVAYRNYKIQNILILAASYYFYGSWDWKFLILLIFISITDYVTGLGFHKITKRYIRKLLFYFAICINLGILVYFKYFNFFIDSFIELFSKIGITLNVSSLNVILPIGISFYTFLSLSYIIDVYKRKLVPSTNFIELFAALSFFPIILAGPIHRPAKLILQFRQKREFNSHKAIDGLRQVLWGLFKKIVVADTCARYADFIFSNHESLSGFILLIGAVFYTFQIYCDFSGYSDIAIGTARLFGFNIMKNFAFPYFARDIIEFWRRWHISLTQWFRDYIFLPFAYWLSRKIKAPRVINIKTEVWIYILGILLTWSLTGLWHGANWTFIFWGMLHAFFLVLYHLTRKSRKRNLKRLGIKNKNKILILFESSFTFIIIVLSWVFFRADSIHKAFNYLSKVFSESLLSFSLSPLEEITDGYPIWIICIFIIMLSEWLQRKKQHALELDNAKIPRIFRWATYYAIIGLIIWVSSDQQTQQEFIYFQF